MPLSSEYIPVTIDKSHIIKIGERLYRSLAANPDLSPFGAFPSGDEVKGIGDAAEAAKGNTRGQGFS